MSTPDPYDPGTPERPNPQGQPEPGRPAQPSRPDQQPPAAPPAPGPYPQEQHGQGRYPPPQAPGAYPQPAYPQDQYAQGQYPQGYGQQPPENPGRTLGIVGLVLGFFGPLSLVGLILSIVGLRKSRKVGQSNGVAVAGIIVSALVLVGTIVAGIVIGVGVGYIMEQCDQLGPGLHQVDGVTITCG